ncbi:MAG: DUF1998 domain-containing protein [Candidatus Omnitrophota bacterium]|jgi:hypothetical protein|nr:MAG: DUF1998 domain-containing protein [Candidatus Omnitrophota bacterium]
MTEIRNNFKVGEIRPTQILFSYGVGAIVDLPNISVMVMGLEDWNINYMSTISEERLLAAVKDQLGSQVTSLKLPPIPEDASTTFYAQNTEQPPIGIPVAPFPRWLRCPACDLIAPIFSGIFELKPNYNYDKIRYIHENCPKTKKPPTVLPVRFLVACEDGHLDDFPWIEFVHKGPTSCKSMLKLIEHGVSGTARDIEIVCEVCKKSRRMSEAFEKEDDVLPRCRGRHPHLRMFSEKGCKEKRKMTPILLGASNLWFPITLSALHIPSSENKLRQLVNDHWNILEQAVTIEILQAFGAIGQLKALAEFSIDEIWKAVDTKRNSDQPQNEEIQDLKTPEWNVIINPKDSQKTADFQIKEVAVPKKYEKYFTKVVLIERIKEVRALTGFTRIESPGDYYDLTEIPEVKQTGLSRKSPTWIPASLVRGEGIFLQFNEAAILAWLKNNEIRKIDNEFFKAHCDWRKKRRIQPENSGFPGIRFILIHSFSHTLMRQFALECGYSAASIRERIYSRDSGKEMDPMAGLLIYTAAPDSEGTLGGLVNLGNPDVLGRHIDHGLEHMRLCSSDPLCAEHTPSSDCSLHGAACHACLFVPETSCERGNKYLDRSLITETVGINTCFSFFKNK